MSIMPMYKHCPNCRRHFTYNPDVGDLGIICPNCGKPVIVSALKKGKKKLGSIIDIIKNKR